MAVTSELNDIQWCVLDLLMRAKQVGITRLNRIELLHASKMPQGVALKIVFAALTMPNELVTWPTQHDFEVTEQGAQLYNLRFGNGTNPQPTHYADQWLALEGK